MRRSCPGTTIATALALALLGGAGCKGDETPEQAKMKRLDARYAAAVEQRLAAVAAAVSQARSAPPVTEAHPIDATDPPLVHSDKSYQYATETNVWAEFLPLLDGRTADEHPLPNIGWRPFSLVAIYQAWKADPGHARGLGRVDELELALGHLDRLRYLVVVRPTVYEPPQVDRSLETFAPGRFRGDALLYDLGAAPSPVCLGGWPIDVGSDVAMATAVGAAQATVDRNLAEELAFAIYGPLALIPGASLPTYGARARTRAREREQERLRRVLDTQRTLP